MWYKMKITGKLVYEPETLENCDRIVNCDDCIYGHKVDGDCRTIFKSKQANL